MKKIILLISGIFVIFAVFLTWNFMKKEKSNEVLFADIKMAEGVISNINGSSIVVQADKPQDGLGVDEEVEVIEFLVNENTKLEKTSEEIKTEEDFRKEETEYRNWRGMKDEEKNIMNFKLTPTWNKCINVNLSDFKIKETVKILYYQDNNKLTAFWVVGENNNNLVEEAKVENKELNINFSAEFLEASIDGFSVKLLNNLGENAKEGDTVFISINEKTLLQAEKEKSELDFRKEEEIYRAEKLKIKNEGGDISELETPSWFSKKNISLNDFKMGDEINLDVTVNGDKYLGIKIVKITK